MQPDNVKNNPEPNSLDIELPADYDAVDRLIQRYKAMGELAARVRDNGLRLAQSLELYKPLGYTDFTAYFDAYVDETRAIGSNRTDSPFMERIAEAVVQGKFDHLNIPPELADEFAAYLRDVQLLMEAIGCPVPPQPKYQ